MQVLSIPDYFPLEVGADKLLLERKREDELHFAAFVLILSSQGRPGKLSSAKVTSQIRSDVNINAKRKEGAIGSIVCPSTNLTGFPANEH